MSVYKLNAQWLGFKASKHTIVDTSTCDLKHNFFLGNSRFLKG